MVQSRGSRAQMVKTFVRLHLYLAGRCCENSENARGPGNNMVSRRKSIVPFFNRNNLLPPRQVLRDKLLLKNKIARGNAH